MATETKKSTTLIILLVFILSIGLIAGHKWTFASDKTDIKVELAQETEAEIQEGKAIEQEKEQEQEKEKEQKKKTEKVHVKILSAQEKEEIEKELQELMKKLNVINLDLFPVKVGVKMVKDGDKAVLVKDVYVATQLSEELTRILKELKVTMSDIKADGSKKIHVDVDVEPVLAQEKTLTEEEKEKIRKKIKEIKLKLCKQVELKDMKLKVGKQVELKDMKLKVGKTVELKDMKLKVGKTVDVKLDPEFCIVLQYDYKVDKNQKVSVQVKPKLAVKVKPEFPEEAEKEGIYGEVVVEGTTDKEGNVIKVEIIKGAHELLNEAVVNAVKQWKYELPEHKGKTYAITFTVTVRFNPEDKDKDKEGKSWTVKIDK